MGLTINNPRSDEANKPTSRYRLLEGVIKMYYTEKVINGILHWRSTPNGEWREMSKDRLTSLVIKYKKALERVRDFDEDDEDEYGDPGQLAIETLASF